WIEIRHLATREDDALVVAQILDSETCSGVVLSCCGVFHVAKKQALPYNEANQACIRSSPRLISVDDVAYDKRMWSRVPKASPGTVTTWASCSRRLAISAAVPIPALPKYFATLG